MPYTSKFTERFDLDPVQSVAGTSPPSPTMLSCVYSSSSMAGSDHNLSNCTTLNSTSVPGKPISISQKTTDVRKSMPPSTASPPLRHGDKHNDALATKFKHFLGNISSKRKERSSAVATPIARVVSTKY